VKKVKKSIVKGGATAVHTFFFGAIIFIAVSQHARTPTLRTYRKGCKKQKVKVRARVCERESERGAEALKL
jgi:hypothetical protein